MIYPLDYYIILKRKSKFLLMTEKITFLYHITEEQIFLHHLTEEQTFL